MQDDPPGSRVIGYLGEASDGMVLITEIGAAGTCMPFDQTAVVDGLRSALVRTRSGLVEAATGCDLAGRRFAYTIVKGEVEPSRVQYTLTLHAESKGATRFQLQGFFTEKGTSGVRDAFVPELKRRDGTVCLGDDGLQGWLLNPYDVADDGVLVNLSESHEYDAMFPDHPLTQARVLVGAVGNSAS